MPTRYILAANHITPMKVPIMSMIESTICHAGTSVAAILDIILIGEVSGKREAKIARLESGFSIILVLKK